MFACVRVCPIYEYHRCRRDWGKDTRLRRKWKKTNVCFFFLGYFSTSGTGEHGGGRQAETGGRADRREA